MHLIEIRGLYKSFKKRTVVRGASYFVDEGEIVGLLGRNGAGKTTSFRMTLGLLRPDQGQVIFKGEDVTHLPIYMRARIGIGYLSQEPSIFHRLTVWENIMAILETMDISRDEREVRCHEILDELGMLKLRDSLATTLSGGERRRLEIARSLTSNPSLILLDEPFSGVDPIAVIDIQEIIISLKRRGIGVLLTDHNVRETLSVTDRSYILDDGIVIASGKPRALVENPLVRKTYLGENFTL